MNAPPVVLDSNDRLWIVLSHLSIFLGVGLLLPLVIYLVKREDSPLVGDQAKEALNFHLSVVIYGLLCIPLMFVLIGIPLLIAIGIAAVVFSIIAAVRSSNGEAYRYPLTLRLVK
jgi:uncharacterized Tic20 family protein